MNNFFSHHTATIDDGAVVGANTKIWHYTHIMESVVIGTDCTIGQNVMIANGVIIGNNVKVQNNVSLYTGILCEDDVFIGPSAVFTNVINPRSAVNRKSEFKKTILKKGATIGANSTIICGVTIGNYAFVGAGSVVTKSIAPYVLVVGNPAKQMGWISELGNKLIFDTKGLAVCNESNTTYLLTNGEVSKVTK